MHQVHAFIADSAPQAVAQIRQELGPEAVVLNVRKLPAAGLARLWQRPRIEVLARAPEPPPPLVPAAKALTELRQELAKIRHKTPAPGRPAPESACAGQSTELPGLVASAAELVGSIEAPQSAPASASGIPQQESATAAHEPKKGVSQSQSAPTSPRIDEPGHTTTFLRRAAKACVVPAATWQMDALLEHSGLLPVHVQQVLDRAQDQLETNAPESLAAELEAVRTTLIQLWRRHSRQESYLHVFIGPPGVGKTTVLCKWLANAVLVQGRPARVWRLDSQVANTAESLSVLAEILRVPIERFEPREQPNPAELVFVDLPGVNGNDPAALKELARRIETLPEAEVHLVLNAAYEGHLLLDQGRAFSGLPVTDVILTHLDEEPRWGKLWNFVLGTNYTVGFLSAGQNLPGDFEEANPERMLAGFLPQKTGFPPMPSGSLMHGRPCAKPGAAT
jgi:flagellar biosynthesis protein FlhF